MELLFMEKFGKAFIPKKIRPGLRRYLLKAGIDNVPYKFFGGLFYATLIITLIVYIFQIYPSLIDASPIKVVGITFLFWLAVNLALIAVVMIIFYFYLNIKIYQRTKDLEDRLPDYLTLVSTNLKGGMSFENALWGAIKPEFGILAKEIAMVSKMVMTGNDVAEALMHFGMKYDSPILRRSINLIIGELESGGGVVNVIDRVIENLKKTSLLKQEMAATTVTYMIFIGAIVCIIAPMLFALAFQLTSIITTVTTRIAVSSANNPAMPFQLSAATLQKRDFQIFSTLALGIIAVFSASIVSIIEKGNVKGGIKYIPIFLITSEILYIIFMFVFNMLFGSLAG